MSGRKFKPSEYDIWLGQTIAITRQRFGMSQKDVAKKVGITFQQIQKYETADNRLSVGVLKKIADAFEMGIGELTGDGITGKYPHDKYVLQLINLIYSRIKTPQKRKMLLLLAQSIANADTL